LASTAFDYLFSVANLRIIPPDILARARSGAINFHDSLLPAYGGLNATSWAIMAGEAVHGITWHEMTAEIDRGRILKQQSFGIRSDDTAFALNARCFEAAAESFSALIDDLRSGRSRPTEQEGPRSWFGRNDRPAEAATIDLGWPAQRIVALVRALDFGRYDNPLGRAKLYVGDDVLMVQSAEIVAARPFGPPGRLISIGDDFLVASSADADIRFSGLLTTCGGRPADVLQRNGLAAGDPMPVADAARLTAVTRLNRHAAAFEGRWARAFQQVVPAALPYPRRGRGEPSTIALDAADALPGPEPLAAAFIAWLARVTNAPTVSLAWRDSVLAEAARDIEPWFSAAVPVTIETDPRGSVEALTDRLVAAIKDVRQAGPYCRDLPFRKAGGESVREALAGMRFGIDLAGRPDRLFDGCDVVLSVDPVGERATVRFPNGMFAPAVAQTIARHFAFFLEEVRAPPERRLEDMTLVPPEERAAIDRANRTAAPFTDASGVAQEICRQVRRTPDREAIRWGDEVLDYAALEARAASIVRRLEACGAVAGTIIGIHLERTPDLVAAVLAVLSLRAAYLPLDPAYPAERVGLMLEDSHAAIVITESRLAGQVAREGVTLLMLDSEADTPAAARPTSGLDRANGSPDDLAYVIYTSGSTGRPKGVAITHRNVLNFFAGMDARVPHADGGRWLAVTSLSFDISVLELLWTLARGFTVVLHGKARQSRTVGPAFSLFYFASDSSAGGDKYRLLIEGAKFADLEGFDAVWTPERHFHAFGGLYPNPAITSAAIATVTERVAIRAGSCVLPLHNAVRAAEDWALVDNLSNGRVGLSLASGWQPNDFVLAPEAFADRKNIMLSGVETLRRLWRGDKLALRNPAGETVETGTLPRPVQQEIPLWLTAAGNPETFRQAGALRCGVLTHLLGQSLDDLARKIDAYRQAWRAAGHAGRGHVTLMLHAFVGESDEGVRDLVRGPM
ncbi:MAG TPA: MupA/Atu3671 family FMN-dependent luciferase-like monooxygenase, partial [Reyranella sp.]|nr:MupA/Atu3671 family FMN-dependent luciferase-like monooxygenase [Reyranella sp.]